MTAFARSALLCFFLSTGFGVDAACALAQTASSDYTTSLPSVDKVKSQLQGTEPTDTIARQVSVFSYLQTYIERIKDTRDYGGPYTPGEQKLMGEYSRAGYQLSQDFQKTHTPTEVKAFQQLEGRYEINNALNWIKQLEGQQAADTYKGTEGALAQSYKQHEDQLQQQLKQGSSEENGGLLGGLLGGGGGSLDADERRCLELGGAYNECAGLLNGLGKLLGGSSDEPPALNGVVLVGVFHSRSELAGLSFGKDGMATLTSCGRLVDEAHRYSVRKSGTNLQFILDNEPDPIAMTLRPDGSLSGPGSIQVKGNVVSGYHNQYVCSNGNCTTSSYPTYSPQMGRCTVSLLAPQAPPPPQQPTKQSGLIGSLAESIGGDTTPLPVVYGIRMTGAYAGTAGMKLEFKNAAVTLDCGQAHVSAPYTVESVQNGFAVRVQNSGGAFLLAVAPDNSLRGSGSATVNGRLVSGVNGKVVNFKPQSESCPVGTFTPRGKRNTMVASNGPMPAVPASYASSSPVADAPAAAPIANATVAAPIADSLASAGIATGAGGSRAQLRIFLSCNFTGANPLAGQAIFVSRKPMDQILRELGVAVPAGATPAQAMKSLQMLCHSPQGCTAIMQKLPSYWVTTAKLDTAGKTTLNATTVTGQYYFFAIIPANGGTLMWDVPAALAAGDNNVTFAPDNSERVQ